MYRGPPDAPSGCQDPSSLPLVLQGSPADCPALAPLICSMRVLSWRGMVQALAGSEPGRGLLKVNQGGEDTVQWGGRRSQMQVKILDKCRYILPLISSKIFISPLTQVLVTWLDLSPDPPPEEGEGGPAPPWTQEACHIALRVLSVLLNDAEALATLDRSVHSYDARFSI